MKRITSLKIDWYDNGLTCADFIVHQVISVYRNKKEIIYNGFNGISKEPQEHEVFPMQPELCEQLFTLLENAEAHNEFEKDYSLGSGQVLHCPYKADKAKLVLREMADLLVLDMVDKGLATDQIVVTVGYDIENLTDPERSKKYHGAIVKDHYGRAIPKHSHGTINLDGHTSSTKKIMCAVSELFDRIVDKNLLIRRLNITANHVLPEADAPKKNGGYEQLDLFTDYAALEAKQAQEQVELEREKKMQQAMLTIKKKFGKNAILKGMNLEEGATAMDRNAQIGGHKA